MSATYHRGLIEPVQGDGGDWRDTATNCCSAREAENCTGCRNSDGKCGTTRVSSDPLPTGATAMPDSAASSVTLFESKPCLSPSKPFDDSESGGRLAWSFDGRLLLTLGDFGFIGSDGGPAAAQTGNSDYGKTLLLDHAGGYQFFTTGHRNPQGLFIGGVAGLVWETEHGPQGGDELNLLHQGKNYGWPFTTYGTAYGTTYWP